MAAPSNEPDSKPPAGDPRKTPTVGLALGAGGAKGIAHIPILEAFDELGIKPHRIAGSSIGAVIGSLYASGRSAQDIKDKVERLAITDQDTVRGVLSDKKIHKWMKLIDADFNHSGLFKTASVISGLWEDEALSTFDKLAIPLRVVATDFWERKAVVFDSGPVQPAVEASMALPGVFTPVQHDGRVLIDGGTVNPVPFDILQDSCDIVVAVDINSGSPTETGTVPGYFDTIFGTVQILQQAIVDRATLEHAPDIYVKPDLRGFRTLQFYKADEIYRQTQPAKDQLKRDLEARLGAPVSADLS